MEAAAVTPQPPQVISGHEQPRILRPLAIAAMAALGLVTIANLLALWADVLQLGIANDLQGGRRVPFDELTASDDRVTTTGLLQSGCYLVCIVAFLAWYGRAYRNLRRLGVHELRWGQGWAIAYWFIPIANLFRPKQVVNDIWRASDPDLPAGNWWDRRVPALIHLWWGAWLISTFLERIFFRQSAQAGDSPADFVSLSQTYVAWDLIDIIPALLAVLVVRSITARQEERRRRFESGELVAPPPEPVEAPPEPQPIPMDVAPPSTLSERLARRT